MTKQNPQLAEDAVLDTLDYGAGYWFMPKIDGVRGMHTVGQFTGRSLDPFAGFGVTEFFSRSEYVGFDGEVTLGPDPAGERLCSLTTGAMGKFNGVTERADFHWHLFDYLGEDAASRSYEERYDRLCDKVSGLILDGHVHLHLVGAYPVHSKADVLRHYAEALDHNYEGGILRRRGAPPKFGRSTKLQEFVRMKPWQDDEMMVDSLEEGETNNNEAKTNSLGRTERSSAKAGKAVNGTVGTICGHALKDIFSNVTGAKLFHKDQPMKVGPGKMTAPQRKHFWEHQSEIVGHVIKFKHLAYGVKDQPRMGTYLSHRLPQDMS